MRKKKQNKTKKSKAKKTGLSKKTNVVRKPKVEKVYTPSKFKVFAENFRSKSSELGISYKGEGRGGQFRHMYSMWNKVKDRPIESFTYSFDDMFKEFYSINTEKHLVDADERVKQLDQFIKLALKDEINWWYLKTDIVTNFKLLLGFKDYNIKIVGIDGKERIYNSEDEIMELYKSLTQADKLDRDNLILDPETKEPIDPQVYGYVYFRDFSHEIDPETGKLSLVMNMLSTFNNIERVTKEGDEAYKKRRDAKKVEEEIKPVEKEPLKPEISEIEKAQIKSIERESQRKDYETEMNVLREDFKAGIYDKEEYKIEKAAIQKKYGF